MRKESPHPLLLIVFLLGISALITGCETFALRHAPAEQNPKHVFLFRDETRPSMKFSEVGILTEKGGVAEQDSIETKFVRKAKQAGADGLIMAPRVHAGDDFKGLPIADSYLYKATMVIFDREAKH